MLSIKVDSVFCSLPSDAVQHIDQVASITVLPFVQLPIEGLTNFNGHPLIQIDVASVIGIDRQQRIGNKRLIVNYAQTSYALRVDDVLSLAKTESSSVRDKTQQSVRSLSLKELLAFSKKKKKITASPQEIKIKNVSKQAAIPILLVASGDRTIAFLTNTIDHLQKIESLQTLSEKSSQGDFLIKVKNHLLPTYFLGQFLGQEDIENESVAIIFKGEQTMWALCVQQVLKMEYADNIYSSAGDARGLWCVTQTGEIRELMDANNLPGLYAATSSPRLWCVTPNGQIQELVDANQFVGRTNDPLAIAITTLQETSVTFQDINRLTVDGLRIYCGMSSYLLPLTMAISTDTALDRAALLTQSRFADRDRSRRSNRIPYIDGNALLFGKSGSSSGRTVRVNLGLGNDVLLGIDRVILSQSLSIASSWVTVDLPYPAALFFDAALYDEQTGQWILRFIETIRFFDLPWIVKKSVVKAIIGWADRD